MKRSIILLFILFTGFSCDEITDLNINKNQPESVDSNLILPGIIRPAVNESVFQAFLLGNNAAQLTAKTLRAEVDTYNWNSFPTTWENFYGVLADVKDLEEQAIESGNTSYEAVAIILKSWMFSVLTDAYGDIPYSEALQAEDQEFFPVYDRQEEIYTGADGLLAELARANTLLEQSASAINGDILFQNDLLKWQKFANALRLRLLMHMSTKMDISGEMQSIVSNEPLMTSNEDNAVLGYLGEFPNEYPLVPLKQGDFDAVVMSRRSVTVMESFNDPRLGVYARSDDITAVDRGTTVYTGAVNGSENPELCAKDGSRLGVIYYNYPNHFSVGEKADGIIMTYAEQLFILAEASQKGMISGDPGMYYEQAIKASMSYYNVDYARFGWEDFQDYYANSGVSYLGDLNQIRQQKWLSLFFHGLEPYFELRRWLYEEDWDWSSLDFVGPTCQNVNNDQLPVRFFYPGEEKSLNSDNYEEVVNRLGGDDINTPIWIIE